MNILSNFENSFDIGISEALRGLLESETWVEWMTIISCFFVFFFVIAFLFIFKKDMRWIGIIMLISLVLTFILNDLVLKKAFQRDRPFVYFGIEPPGFFIDGYSFPSGHSAISTTGAFSFFFYYLFMIKDKKENRWALAFSIIFIVLDLLIMFSRIALLHHYLTDTLGGFLEGILVSLLVVFTYYLIRKRIEKKPSVVIKKE